jgi:H+/Cl- antiporter ClcA
MPSLKSSSGIFCTISVFYTDNHTLTYLQLILRIHANICSLSMGTVAGFFLMFLPNGETFGFAVQRLATADQDWR